MTVVVSPRPTASGPPTAKKFSLSDFRKGGKNLPPRIVCVGRAGVGKTSLGANTENPVFLMSPGETGLSTLIDSGQLPADIPNLEVQTFNDCMGYIEALTVNEHSRKTLIVDVVNGVEKLANLHTRQRDYPGENGDKEFTAYQSGYRTCAMGAWREFLAALDKLRREKQMLILLLAHTGVAKVANPSGGDFSKWSASFDGRWSWEATFAWCDLCLFADFDVTVVKDRKADAKGKAVSSGRRYFHTQWAPDYDAKSRFPIPDEVEMGSSGKEAWDNLTAAIAASKTNNTKE